MVISTHALREEGDPTFGIMYCRLEIFLPTPSARRATDNALATLVADDISTHALREEGDTGVTKVINQTAIFLPTPSARRATA